MAALLGPAEFMRLKKGLPTHCAGRPMMNLISRNILFGHWEGPGSRLFTRS